MAGLLKKGIQDNVNQPTPRHLLPASVTQFFWYMQLGVLDIEACALWKA